jgi:hypothetical protein
LPISDFDRGWPSRPDKPAAVLTTVKDKSLRDGKPPLTSVARERPG